MFHTFPYAYHYHISLAKLCASGSVREDRCDHLLRRLLRPRAPAIRAKIFCAGRLQDRLRKNWCEPGATDLNPVLAKIRRAHPDILLGLVQTTDGITLTKQAYVQRLGVPYLIGTAYPQLKQWQDATAEAQEGWIGVTTYIPGLKAKADSKYPKLFPDSDKWIAEFTKRYNREPEFIDVGAYVSTCMLLIAIDKAGGDDKEKVAEELKKLDVHTMIGRGHFAPTGNGTLNQAFSDVVVHQRVKGKDAILFPKEFETTTTVEQATYPK